MKRIKVIGIILVIVFIVVLVATMIATCYFYNLALNPNESKDVIIEENMAEEIEGRQDLYDYEDWLLKESGYKTLYLKSFDGYWLHSYEITNQNAGNRYVIAVHGYMASAKNMAEVGKYFYDRGYHVILPDLRGHGESEGDFISMGWYESSDIIQLVDYIITKDSDAKIVLAGQSMGAATVLIASGEKLSDNVKVVIGDCSYTSIWDEFAYEIKELFALPVFPILYTTSLYTRIKDGYFFGEVSPVEQVKKSEIPTLFIHGSEDTFVPVRMLDELYDACSAPKQKLIVEGAGHAQSLSTDPAQYKKTLDEFLSKYGM